jgi:hypothetical protein
VEKCLECDRYELEIKSLEMGNNLARADVVTADSPKQTKDKNFEVLLLYR